MYNPFVVPAAEDTQNDLALITSALEGSRKDLTRLIRSHQAWIYNIAYKMVCDHEDAEDITQEILIKIVTKLSTFDPGKSLFRTWLYRIVANHVINMKKRKYELLIGGLEGKLNMDMIPDGNDSSNPENSVLLEEMRIRCYCGWLLCLNRKQRLVFILGGIFDIPDSVGSEILDISKQNFRKILSRSRERLYNFLNQNCGLINKRNSCRCSTKVSGLIQMGFMDPEDKHFYKDRAGKIKDVIHERISNFKASHYREYVTMFRDDPFYEPRDLTKWLQNMVDTDQFNTLIQL